jgi:hypothetical protein
MNGLETADVLLFMLAFNPFSIAQQMYPSKVLHEIGHSRSFPPSPLVAVYSLILCSAEFSFFQELEV